MEEKELTFEQIFDKDGQYTSDSFVEGFCLEITNGVMAGVQYKDKDDLLPEKWLYSCFRGLFKKKYRKVYTRQSLFSKTSK